MSQTAMSAPPPVPSGPRSSLVTTSPVNSNEDIVFSIYCVIYQLQNSSWVVIGNGWSQLHLCVHRIQRTFRIVAMSVQSQKNVMNVNLTHACKYRRKSPDFHKLTCSNSDVWGFGFFSSPSSLEQAATFLTTVDEAHAEISKSVARRLSTSAGVGRVSQSSNPFTSPSRTRGVSYAQVAGSPGYDRPSVSSLASNFGGAVASPSSTKAPPVPSRARTGTTQGESHRTLPFSPAQPSHHSSSNVSAPAVPAAPATGSGNYNVVAPAVPNAPSAGNSFSGAPAYVPARPSAASMSTTGRSQANSVAVGSNFPPPPSADASAHSDNSNIIPTAHVRQLGDLKVLPPKLLATVSTDNSITTPISVRHTAHVAYNRKKGTFEGLPQDWEKHLDQVYGQPLEKLEMSQFPYYEGKIPKIFVELARRFFEQGAIDSVGIFRLAPDQSESEAARRKIDNGELIGSAASDTPDFSYDVNVIASLIKVWLRDLPVKLWDSVNKARVESCQSEFEAWQIVQSLAPAARPVCEFLIDVCVTICKNEQVNKMTSQNLSICISPNLFTENRDQPMSTLIFSQKIAKVFGLAIDYRRFSFPNTDVSKMFS